MSEPSQNLVPTDALALRARDGDVRAWEELMLETTGPLQALVYRILLDWHETRDVAQETFIRAWRALPRYRPEGKFQSWLFRMGVRLAYDTLRKRKHQPISESLWVGGGGRGGEALGGKEDAAAEHHELQAAIEAAVRELPPDQRTAFVLSEFQDASHAAIAEVLECSVKAVEMHLYRARQTLRERLKSWL